MRFIWACDAQNRLMTAALPPDHILTPWDGQALLDNPSIRDHSGAMGTTPSDSNSSNTAS
jgi:hypothetical protein